MHDNPIFLENEQIALKWKERIEIFKDRPQVIFPWWLISCKVKVLLVADGILDFGPGDFGLSTFVSTLVNDGRSYVKFEITLAHRNESVTDMQVQIGEPGIAGSIKGFRFDNTSHFTESKFDQVWLFGIETTQNALNTAELNTLSKFMNGGGGVFATGDHGSLGNALCGNVTRVRAMRRWNNSSGEVGMGDSRRNDTNRLGRETGSQFDDQSDDIPQTINAKLYSSHLTAFWRDIYPHPLLCSPLGAITVLPDHPHEGECIEPTNLNQTYSDSTPEFPMGVAPEIIATSTVPAGNTAGGSKSATQAHSFGAICAYDGHKANIGRVVTDATWHHFVNVNLIGEIFDVDGNRGNGEHASKQIGFLYSTQGQQHFKQIKHYYKNIAVWISRPSNHQCFRTRIIWQLTYQHRILEASMDDPDLNISKISPSLLYSIGTHATDVLGSNAGQCRKLQLVLELVKEVIPDFIPKIDPWVVPSKRKETSMVPWIDLNPVLSMALGGSILALREQFGSTPKPVDENSEGRIWETAKEGAKRGISISKDAFQKDLKFHSRLF